MLIAIDVDNEQLETLKAVGDVEITIKNQNTLEPADVADKNIIVGNIAPKLLKDCKALEFLQLNSAGFDNYVGVLDPKIKAAWFGAGLLIGFAAYKFAVPKIKALMVKPAETVEKAE